MTSNVRESKERIPKMNESCFYGKIWKIVKMLEVKGRICAKAMIWLWRKKENWRRKRASKMRRTTITPTLTQTIIRAKATKDSAYPNLMRLKLALTHYLTCHSIKPNWPQTLITWRTKETQRWILTRTHSP